MASEHVKARTNGQVINLRGFQKPGDEARLLSDLGAIKKTPKSSGSKPLKKPAVAAKADQYEVQVRDPAHDYIASLETNPNEVVELHDRRTMDLADAFNEIELEAKVDHDGLQHLTDLAKNGELA